MIGIVNRRASDLVDKAHGILYTSDGRDVEMSVASTKAFYAQVAAGALLACAITEAAQVGSDQRRHELLTGLRALPDAMRAVLAKRSRDRRRGTTLRSTEALLGRRRQRPQPGRRRGGSDQAQRVVLQVDRLRRHRGQEAHRSVERTADPRVRGRAAGQHRRRRRQGNGDLQGPQSDRDRDRRRRRGALQRGCHDHRAAGRSGLGFRAVGDGRSPVRIRSGTGDRRLGASTARDARTDRARRSPTSSTATAFWQRFAPRLPASSDRSTTVCENGSTTVTSRPVRRFAWSGCCVTCGRRIRSRRMPADIGQGRDARRVDR